MQLHLLVPFLVMIYTNFKHKIGDLLMLAIIIGSMGLNCYIIDIYQLRCGVLAVENYGLVDKYFSKPWTKLFAVALGVYFANLYVTILAYRKCQSHRDRKENFPWVHYLHEHALPSHLMFWLGIFQIIYGLLLAHPAIADPYSWSNF